MTMTPSDYRTMYETSLLTKEPKKISEIAFVCRIALANETLYKTVSRMAVIPWPLIVVIHFRESSQNFKTHLHNGDPLTARTVHVPKDRPIHGRPPFTWIESAVDALTEVWTPVAWDIAGCLEFLERYNGLGYQKRGRVSPYLWNYTDKYVSGLYVADGKFDPEKVEQRPGCVALLKALESKGVSLDFSDLAARDSSLH